MDTPEKQVSLWVVLFAISIGLNITTAIRDVWLNPMRYFFYSAECHTSYGTKTGDANGILTVPSGRFSYDELTGFIRRDMKCDGQLQVLSMNEVS